MRSDNANFKSNYSCIKRASRFLAIACILATSPALAKQEIYKSNTLEISAAYCGNAVVFTQSNPWFGEDVANIGVDVDNWAEFSAEPQLRVTFLNVLAESQPV